MSNWAKLCILVNTACLSVLIGFYLGRGSKEREKDVIMWTEAAYSQGLMDCSLPKDVQEHNKKFSVDAVVAAHNGAWHW